VFQRFTDRARRVLVLAQEEARLLNHGFIGTEHILLGLLHEGEGVAANVLTSVGVSLDAARERVAAIIGRTSRPPDGGSPPFTPRAKKVMELASREAKQLGHDDIGTEHLLLGLLREGEGVASQVLVSLGADLGRVRQAVIRTMDYFVEPRPTARPAPRVRTGLRDLCSLCGRDLWQSAHVVAGPRGWACDECIRAGSGLLQAATDESREVVLPPRVSGHPPEEEATGDIVAVVESAFGPNAGPASWATTVEEPARFEPLLRRLTERWGRPEATRMSDVGFISPRLAYVRFSVLFEGSRGTDVSGQLRRHDRGWLVTAETLTALLGRSGIREE
jgi:hypothetical protein